MHGSCQERNALTGVLGGEFCTFSPVTVLRKTSKAHTGHRTCGAAGIGSYWSQSASRNWGYSTACCTEDLTEVSSSPRSLYIGSVFHRRDKLKLETTRPTNTSDNQMEKGKHKNLITRNHGYLSGSNNKSSITQHTRKATCRFKIITYDADRGL